MATRSSVSSVPFGGVVAAGRKLAPILAWGVVPLALAILGPLGSGGTHYAGDFHSAFWPAGQRILHGLSPYPDPGDPVVGRGIAFVYPAVGALLLTPFALIPREVADALFVVLNIAAFALTLRVLGVRDWRVYGAGLVSLPVYAAWLVGNITLLLGLGVALAWRYRDRPAVSGLLIALVVSSKMFLLPLGLWLLATRRYAALAYTVASGVVLNAVAWAVLGFNELDRYLQLMRALTTAEEGIRYSLTSLLLQLGGGHTVAYGLAFVLAAACAVACITLGRRGRDVQALALAIAVGLLVTPIAQIHYFALLMVPLAVARPRLGLAWVPPLLMWLCVNPRSSWQVALSLVLAGAMVLAALTARYRPSATHLSWDAGAR